MTPDMGELLTKWTESEQTRHTATVSGWLTDHCMRIEPVGIVLDKGARLARCSFVHPAVGTPQ